MYNVCTVPGMSSPQPGRKRERFDLRATPVQAAVIRAAARQTDRTVTEFVVETAVQEAQRILADNSHFVLEDADWRAFNEILDRPSTLKPRLAALMQPDGSAPA
jgi:uncharacterized protein (DUF1778 family)